jgi:hypothetical protein
MLEQEISPSNAPSKFNGGISPRLFGVHLLPNEWEVGTIGIISLPLKE